ncbi:CMRF35-like molecule 7 [Galemys pyrenaicus]|uniref:CMRF35-like molecule 7 n=1 Tax=Galemys pyrenaicus TaxID=202257 RepID=A0A8J5ZU48_GALPY|nr:CMRF35-like molecule 7 [Galemys pyrenaicus]
MGGERWGEETYACFCFAGCLSIRGPEGVSSPAGGLVTIGCSYDSEWETYVKWWCRGEYWHSCNILVRTNGSEHKTKRGRLAIQDDQGRREVTVTMEELRTEDEDIYWCGIERKGTDLGHQVHVSVYPGRPLSPVLRVQADPQDAGPALCLPQMGPEPGLHAGVLTGAWGAPTRGEAARVSSAQQPSSAANIRGTPPDSHGVDRLDPKGPFPAQLSIAITTASVTTEATTLCCGPEADTLEAPTSASPEPPITWSANSSNLILHSPLTWGGREKRGWGCSREAAHTRTLFRHRSLVCNMHFLILTCVKVPLLGGLLCTMMWLNRSRGTPVGSKVRLSRTPQVPCHLCWSKARA